MSSSTTARQPITHIQALGIPLNRNNIDTDQIIPARFLKGTSKTGLGKHLFHDWRYVSGAAEAFIPNPEFVLNQDRFKQGTVLVAGHNFGCGSSREHAPWALKDYGIQAVVAISFADIFRNNALKNQVIPIVLNEGYVMMLLRALEKNPNLQLDIDVASQTLKAEGLFTEAFPLHAFGKRCLLEGVDEVGYTLSHLEQIKAFETQRQQQEKELAITIS